MSARTLAPSLLLSLLAAFAASPAGAQTCPEPGLSTGNYAAYVRRTQEELPQHGYRTGPPSGQLDEATRKGIRAYQRDAKLMVDGCVTVELLDHMLYHVPKVYAGSAADTALERAVQHELALRGYYKGAIDGIVGPQTIAALEAFQLDAGLRVNPVVNRSTLAAIRDADPAVRAP